MYGNLDVAALFCQHIGQTKSSSSAEASGMQRVHHGRAHKSHRASDPPFLQPQHHYKSVTHNQYKLCTVHTPRYFSSLP
jgi:hypothetical protein